LRDVAGHRRSPPALTRIAHGPARARQPGSNVRGGREMTAADARRQVAAFAPAQRAAPSAWHWHRRSTRSRQLAPRFGGSPSPIAAPLGLKWRRGWDSNARSPCEDAGFQVARLAHACAHSHPAAEIRSASNACLSPLFPTNRPECKSKCKLPEPGTSFHRREARPWAGLRHDHQPLRQAPAGRAAVQYTAHTAPCVRAQG
jgi:hypothetical protein